MEAELFIVFLCLFLPSPWWRLNYSLFSCVCFFLHHDGGWLIHCFPVSVSSFTMMEVELFIVFLCLFLPSPWWRLNYSLFSCVCFFLHHDGGWIIHCFPVSVSSFTMMEVDLFIVFLCLFLPSPWWRLNYSLFSCVCFFLHHDGGWIIHCFPVSVSSFTMMEVDLFIVFLCLFLPSPWWRLNYSLFSCVCFFLHHDGGWIIHCFPVSVSSFTMMEAELFIVFLRLFLPSPWWRLTYSLFSCVCFFLHLDGGWIIHCFPVSVSSFTLMEAELFIVFLCLSLPSPWWRLNYSLFSCVCFFLHPDGGWIIHCFPVSVSSFTMMEAELFIVFLCLFLPSPWWRLTYSLFSCVCFFLHHDGGWIIHCFPVSVSSFTMMEAELFIVFLCLFLPSPWWRLNYSLFSCVCFFLHHDGGWIIHCFPVSVSSFTMMEVDLFIVFLCLFLPSPWWRLNYSLFSCVCFFLHPDGGWIIHCFPVSVSSFTMMEVELFIVFLCLFLPSPWWRLNYSLFSCVCFFLHLDGGWIIHCFPVSVSSFTMMEVDLFIVFLCLFLPSPWWRLNYSLFSCVCFFLHPDGGWIIHCFPVSVSSFTLMEAELFIVFLCLFLPSPWWRLNYSLFSCVCFFLHHDGGWIIHCFPVSVSSFTMMEVELFIVFLCLFLPSPWWRLNYSLFSCVCFFLHPDGGWIIHCFPVSVSSFTLMEVELFIVFLCLFLPSPWWRLNYSLFSCVCFFLHHDGGWIIHCFPVSVSSCTVMEVDLFIVFLCLFLPSPWWRLNYSLFSCVCFFLHHDGGWIIHCFPVSVSSFTMMEVELFIVFLCLFLPSPWWRLNYSLFSCVCFFLHHDGGWIIHCFPVSVSSFTMMEVDLFIVFLCLFLPSPWWRLNYSLFSCVCFFLHHDGGWIIHCFPVSVSSFTMMEVELFIVFLCLFLPSPWWRLNYSLFSCVCFFLHHDGGWIIHCFPVSVSSFTMMEVELFIVFLCLFLPSPWWRLNYSLFSCVCFFFHRDGGWIIHCFPVSVFSFTVMEVKLFTVFLCLFLPSPCWRLNYSLFSCVCFFLHPDGGWIIHCFPVFISSFTLMEVELFSVFLCLFLPSPWWRLNYSLFSCVCFFLHPDGGWIIHCFPVSVSSFTMMEAELFIVFLCLFLPSPWWRLNYSLFSCVCFFLHHDGGWIIHCFPVSVSSFTMMEAELFIFFLCLFLPSPWWRLNYSLFSCVCFFLHHDGGWIIHCFPVSVSSFTVMEAELFIVFLCLFFPSPWWRLNYSLFSCVCFFLHPAGVWIIHCFPVSVSSFTLMEVELFIVFLCLFLPSPWWRLNYSLFSCVCFFLHHDGGWIIHCFPVSVSSFTLMEAELLIVFLCLFLPSPWWRLNYSLVSCVCFFLHPDGGWIIHCFPVSVSSFTMMEAELFIVFLCLFLPSPWWRLNYSLFSCVCFFLHHDGGWIIHCFPMSVSSFTVMEAELFIVFLCLFLPSPWWRLNYSLFSCVCFFLHHDGGWIIHSFPVSVSSFTMMEVELFIVFLCLFLPSPDGGWIIHCFPVSVSSFTLMEVELFIVFLCLFLPSPWWRFNYSMFTCVCFFLHHDGGWIIHCFPMSVSSFTMMEAELFIVFLCMFLPLPWWRLNYSLFSYVCFFLHPGGGWIIHCTMRYVLTCIWYNMKKQVRKCFCGGKILTTLYH